MIVFSLSPIMSTVSPIVMNISVRFSAFFVIIWHPANKTSKLNTTDALRYE